ncbi:aliphatic sulfonate ABC transporter substrate-binding protein [Methylocapsa polymorpha]|uniref:Aliphatic sulfonate ABC transporter substrate-binding protein n=1 Tax=Methylocapsa polymorpha TaxID=3080828 RepID=A0ABZ0HQA0_9HYPH|nr:aliphatic sulfonate ABC transporter substrate-binding protein [Methylocapsa sp. RX1]
MLRREFIRSGGSGLIAMAVTTATPLGRSAFAETAPKEIRFGFQKTGLFVPIRQRRTYENFFNPLGVAVRWVEFQFGPPMLEALNLGSIDFAAVGDAPPIFAQAAAANLYYVAAQPPPGEAVVVAPDSPIRTLADLRGKKIGVPKGSSAHATAVAAVEKAGLAWSDVTPVYLAPADGVAAFDRGIIDAWAIWDPYLAIAEVTKNARSLAFNTEAHDPHFFYLANKAFADKYPAVVSQIADVLAGEAAWAEAHHDEIASLLQEAQGVDLAVEKRVVSRAKYMIEPVNDEIVAGQQATADQFYRLGLIPKKINVRDIVWKWTPRA